MVCVLLTKTAIMPEYVRIGSFENREGVEKARQRHDEEEKVGWGRDLVKKLRRLGSTEGLPHSQSQHAMTAGIWHKSMCVNTEGVGHYDLGCVIACGVDTLYYRTNQDCFDPEPKASNQGTDDGIQTGKKRESKQSVVLLQGQALHSPVLWIPRK